MMIRAKNTLIGHLTNKNSLSGKLSNAIVKEYPELEDLEITPTSVEQNFKSEKYGYDNVKVKAVESEKLNITPTLEEQKYIGVYGEVNVEPANEVFEQGSISTPFYYATRLDNVCGGVTFPENYEAVIKLKKAPAYCGYIFNNAINYKSVTMISEDKTNVVDISALCSVSAARKNETILEKIDLRDFNKKSSNMINFAQYQTKLKSILGVLDLSECKSVTNWLRECTALEDIEIEPNTIKLSISVQHSTLLTKESLLSLINGLYDYSGDTSGTVRTLTIGATNYAKLNESTELKIAWDKGWEVV